MRVLYLGLLLSLCACDDLSRFDTKDGGAYCGSIVDASFVRQGFAQHTRLQLKLDTDRLSSLPGSITSDDTVDGPCAPQATFSNAALRSSEKLQADPLSTLGFGDARELNLMTWVDASCGGSYLGVVSLMRNDDVEIRLMSSEANGDGEEVGPFGVFHLARFSKDCGYDP